MTLGEGKRRVLMMLNEYSSGGALTLNEDLSVRMNDFFDIAQKDVAAWQPIVRCGEIVQPTSITAGTPDDYEFEVGEDAANCLPLFVAAQLIDVSEYQRALYNLYLQMRGMLPHAVPKVNHAVWGGGGGSGGSSESKNLFPQGAGGGGSPDWRLIKARRELGLPVHI